MSKRRENWQGSKWIRPEKRLAIYMRDGLACAYCGDTLEHGANLSLDHIVPDSKGGGNEQTNLITACMTCNSSRGNRNVKSFCSAVASYRNVDVNIILEHIEIRRNDALPMDASKEMLSRRGTLSAIYADYQE